MNGKRIKKKKTGAVKSNDPHNPIWNEAFNFNLPATNLPNAALEVIKLWLKLDSYIAYHRLVLN